MRRWIAITMLLAGLAAGAAPLANRAVAFPPPPGGPKKPGPKHGPGHDLQKAYDRITEASLYLAHGGKQAPADSARLFDQVKQMYRTAYDAARDDAGPRAHELSVAAHDAGRGLLHYLRATTPPVTDLPVPVDDRRAPPPPPGADRRPRPPREAGELDAPALAGDELQRAYDRIVDAEQFSNSGPGADFLAASRKAYREGRAAFLENDFVKAAELGRAAEAWTHVGEHLARADEQPLAGSDRRPARDAGPRGRSPRDEPPPPEGRRGPRDRRGPPPPLE